MSKRGPSMHRWPSHAFLLPLPLATTAANPTCARSAKVQLHVGILHRRYERWGAALEAFAAARAIEPSYCEVDYWEGRTRLGELGERPVPFPSMPCSPQVVHLSLNASLSRVRFG